MPRSQRAARNRRTRRRGKAVPKKRGNPGYFLGGPLELLESYFPRYYQSSGNRQGFWSEFWGDWDTTYSRQLTQEEVEEVEEIKRRHGIEQGSKIRVPVDDDDSEEDDDSDKERNPAESAPKVDSGTGDTTNQIATDASSTATKEPNASIEASNQISIAPTDPSTPAGPSNVPAGSSDAPAGPSNAPAGPSNAPAGPSNVPAASTSKASEREKVKVKEKAAAVKPKKRGGKLQRTEEENVLLARAADTEKIKRWFSTRSTKEKANRQSDMEGFIQTLNDQAVGVHPRYPIDFKFYQRHPDFRDKIAAAFKEEHPEIGGGHPEQLKTYTALVRHMFEEESEEVRERIKKEAEEEYRAEVVEYERRLETGIFDVSDVELLQRRRVQMGSLLQNILTGFGKATGTYISVVIMGEDPNPEDDDRIFTSSVQIGTTPGSNPQRFHEWDPTGFRMQHVKSFAEFFRACSRLRKGLEAEPPTHGRYSPETVDAVPNPVIPSAETNDDGSGGNDGTRQPQGKKDKGKQKAGPSRKRKTKGRGSEEEDEAESSEGSGEESADGFQTETDDEDQEEEEEREVEKTPPTTPKLKRGRRILPAMQEELDTMSDRERRRKMRELSQMGKDDFERANIDARNRGLMRQVDLPRVMGELEDSLPKSKKKGKKGTAKEKKETEKEKKEKKGKEKAVAKETQQTRRSTRLRMDAVVINKPPSRAGPSGSGAQDVGHDEDAMVVDEPAHSSAHSSAAILPLPTNAPECMRILHSLVLKLPPSLEQPQDDDPLAALYREEPWGEDMSTRDAWETWNGILDTLLQKRSMETQEEYNARLVKGGKKGTEALYRALAHVMEKVVFDPDMLEGKVLRLNGAILATCPGIGNEPVSSPPPPPSAPIHAPPVPAAPLVPAAPVSTPVPETPPVISKATTPVPAVVDVPENATLDLPQIETIDVPPITTLEVPQTAAADDEAPVDEAPVDEAPVALFPLLTRERVVRFRWVQEMEQYLRAPDVVGDDWKDVVDALMSLEALYGFKSPLKGPFVYTIGVQRGRADRIPAPLPSLTPAEFQVQLVAWWNELMPDWRKLEKDSKELEDRDWKREIGGSWGGLVMPGNNGLYSIVACLRWWLLMEVDFVEVEGVEVHLYGQSLLQEMD
ncbi:hypothetical protein K435DRAFT_887023 [Dendrothele bispora CBS 962.96]|uniref:Uncharacterized protein n=1 Tax=Dendrothele bispora (strain CBS 962.96) TaxID=1314807 RepID=A0A4S8KT90_DENBC|nr:hypothetical protein K435DRAFT_887023 [Dendrothele bispora CBS 962.96]